MIFFSKDRFQEFICDSCNRSNNIWMPETIKTWKYYLIIASKHIIYAFLNSKHFLI